MLVYLFSQWLLQHSSNKGNKFLCGIIYNYTIGFPQFPVSKVLISRRGERQKRKVSTHWTNKNFCLDEVPTSPFTPLTLYFPFQHCLGYVFLFLHLLSFSHICMCRPINNNAKWNYIYIFSHSFIAFLSRKEYIQVLFQLLNQEKALRDERKHFEQDPRLGFRLPS